MNASPDIGAGNLHQALFYGSPDELSATAAPFLRAGLDAGESAVLICRDHNNALIAEALGAHPRLTVLRSKDFYTRPASTASAMQRLVRRELAHGAPRIRIVGEVEFGTDPDDYAEWTRFEAVINDVLAPFPVSGVCPYDARNLPEPLRTGIVHTHPYLLEADGPNPNEAYLDPPTVIRRFTDQRPDPLEATTPTFETSRLTNLAQVAGLRAHLYTVLAAIPVPWPYTTDFLAAISEVVTNGLVHGRPPVRVQMWVGDDRLLCKVTDAGDGFDDPLAGYLPCTTDPRRSGTGLWLTRQVCDRVDTFYDKQGFTVRLTTAIGAAPPSTAGIWARTDAARLRADHARLRAEQLVRRISERTDSYPHHTDRQGDASDPTDLPGQGRSSS